MSGKKDTCYLCSDNFEKDYVAWVRVILETNKNNTPLCDICEALSKLSNPFLSMIKREPLTK